MTRTRFGRATESLLPGGSGAEPATSPAGGRGRGGGKSEGDRETPSHWATRGRGFLLRNAIV